MADLSSLEEAAHRLGEPDVTAAELAQIAGTHPALRPLVAQHPSAYPELRAWIDAANPPPAPVAPVVAPPAGSSAVADPRRATAGPQERRASTWLPWVVAGVAVAVAAGSWLWPRTDSVAAAVPLVSSTSTPTSSGTPAASSAVTFGAPEKSFSTPQEAVAFLTERLAAGDAAGAVSAFATTSAVDHYNFTAQVTRVKIMTPYIWLPSTSPYYRTLNLGQRDALVSTQLRTLTWNVVDPQDDPTMSITVADAAAATSLTNRLDPAPMSHLTLLHLDQIGVAHPSYAQNFPALAAPYGADEYAEFGVLFGTANGPMSGGISFVRYGKRWLIFGLNSALLGNTPGQLVASTEQDYTAKMAPVS